MPLGLPRRRLTVLCQRRRNRPVNHAPLQLIHAFNVAGGGAAAVYLAPQRRPFTRDCHSHNSSLSGWRIGTTDTKRAILLCRACTVYDSPVN